MQEDFAQEEITVTRKLA